MTAFLRFAGWSAVTLIVLASLGPRASRPHLFATPSFDHVAGYAVAACLLGLGYRNRRYLGALVMVWPAGAALLEALQIEVPGRNPRLADIAASAVGAWIGIALATLLGALIRSVAARRGSPPESASQSRQAAGMDR